MPSTNAQRQAVYRARRAEAGDNGDRRINTWVTTAAALALGRLAQPYAVTQREMLERLILSAETAVTDGLDPDSEAWREYFATQSALGPYRGGSREANNALWTIAMVRMRSDARTRAYVARRSAEGLSTKEIQRCLKRYVVRELYPLILADLRDALTTC
jgi:hypothetical protein